MQKTVVITGASGGIGAACAVMATARGWNVAFDYASNTEGAAETVRAVEALGGKPVVLQGDVTDENHVVALFDAAEQAFGGIDALINNAGMIGVPLPLRDIDTDRLRRVIDVNLFGAMLVAREAIRRMATSRGGKGGSIVSISSAAARLGAANERVDYAAAKGGVEALTNGLAKEAASDGIRVNAVRPGLIATEIHARGGQAGRAETLGATVPMGRPGTSEEVAEAVLWLMSDAASYVTGTILDVTGGR